MRQVAILGVAMTKFGISEKTNLEMFAEAGLEAIARSNLAFAKCCSYNARL